MVNPFERLKRDVTNDVCGKSYYPESLWHYTTTQGLIHIIRDRTIRLTDSLFLNDKTEGVYGARIFSERMHIVTRGWPKKELAFARRVFRAATRINDSDRLAVFCMSGTGDLLNQFRDYGKGVQAFSIALKPRLLTQIDAYEFPSEEVVWPGLFPVIYERNKQQEIIDLLIERTRERMREFFEGPDYNIGSRNEILEQAAAQFHYCVVQFKHPAFSGENESRLVVPLPHFADASIPVAFDESPMGPRPYYLLKFRGDVNPFNSLVVGPGDHAEVAAQGARLLLNSRGLGHVEVSPMDAPLRR